MTSKDLGIQLKILYTNEFQIDLLGFVCPTKYSCLFFFALCRSSLLKPSFFCMLSNSPSSSYWKSRVSYRTKGELFIKYEVSICRFFCTWIIWKVSNPSPKTPKFHLLLQGKFSENFVEKWENAGKPAFSPFSYKGFYFTKYNLYFLCVS